MQPLLDAQRQTVDGAPGRGTVFVDGDCVRLCQVLPNLLTNAIKYSPERARIEIKIEGTAVDALISVRDPGIGIDAQIAAACCSIHSCRATARSTASQGGLGVGLTIVKLLVEMHGGGVTAHSAGLGKGSEFRIWLPRVLAPIPVPAAPEGDERKATCVRVACSSSRTTRTRPSPCARCYARSHEVEVVYDGAAGLAKLEDFRADIVLLDIGLPRMDGYMVAHAIRERFALAGRRPKLLALTGYGARRRSQCRAQGRGSTDTWQSPSTPTSAADRRLTKCQAVSPAIQRSVG